MTEGTHTRHVNVVVDEIASHIEEERKEIDFVDLQEYTVQNLQNAIEMTDIGKYIIRALHFAILDESEHEADADINYEDYNRIREAIYHCLKYSNNSKFTDHINYDISSFAGNWVDPNELNSKERGSIIQLALIGHIDPKALNHILQVQLGECGLNSLRPKEAAALYVLQNKLGFNGYIELKEKLEKMTNEICADPKKALSLLHENRNQMTQYVNEKVVENLSESEFLSYITKQPLTCYSEALKNALDKNDEDWINALNEEKPEFMKNLPITRRRAFYNYVRGYFPGYSLHGETARIIYLGLLEDNQKRAENLKEQRKNSFDSKLEDKLKYQMDLKHAKRPKEELVEELEEHVRNILNSCELPPYVESTNLLTYYNNAPALVRKLPNWCKNAFEKVLGASHMNQVKADKESVIANDIVLMKLWQLDLDIQERIQKGEELEILPTDIEAFFDETDTILMECNMGSLHMGNPFHALVRIALAEKALLPLDTFLTFFEFLAIDREEFYGKFIEQEFSRKL